MRPPWTAVLAEHLGERVTERIITDRLWPALVARVDAAARAGHDPAHLVADATGMFAGTLDTVPEHQWATVLLWHLAILTDPAPAEDEEPLHPDPADADLQPPADLHTQSATRLARAVAYVHPTGDENLIPWVISSASRNG